MILGYLRHQCDQIRVSLFGGFSKGADCMMFTLVAPSPSIMPDIEKLLNRCCGAELLN